MSNKYPRGSAAQAGLGSPGPGREVSALARAGPCGWRGLAREAQICSSFLGESERGRLHGAGGRDTSFTSTAPLGTAKCFLPFSSLLFCS